MWPDYKAAKADRRSIGEIERVFTRHILPHFGDRFADAITRAEITRFIDEITGSAPVMARNVLAQFSAFYGWALPRLDRLPANPCRDAGRPPAPKARDRVLSDQEVGRSEEHTSEIQSLMRTSYAVFCLKNTKQS